MFDITVVTSVCLASRLSLSMRVAHSAMTASPSTTVAVLVAQHEAIGVAVERDADVRVVVAHRLAHRLRGGARRRLALMFLPLGLVSIAMTLAPSSSNTAGPTR